MAPKKKVSLDGVWLGAKVGHFVVDRQLAALLVCKIGCKFCEVTIGVFQSVCENTRCANSGDLGWNTPSFEETPCTVGDSK